jgi:PAS domain S-box-containing protein
MVIFVLACSVVLQLLAAVMAIRLVHLTGRRTAWSLIAVALVLMSVRRAIPLYYSLSGNSTITPDLFNELIGLVLSTLMVLGVAGIAPLFSAIRHSHMALREKEELYRTVFENTGTATVLIEENTIISHVNAEFEKLSKCPRQEIEGKRSWTDFVVKEDLDRMRSQHILRREKREAAQKQYEFRFITNEGDIRNIFLSIDMIPGTKRSVASLLDITERKRAEEALHKSNRRLRRVYESGMLGMFYWNMGGQIMDANDKFLEMVGYTRNELEAGKIDWINMTPPEYRCLDDNSVKELQSTGANRTPFEKEYFRKDGTRMPVIIAGAMLDDEHYNGAAFVLDITDRKRAEDALKESERKLREAQEMAHLGHWYFDVKTGHVEWSEEVFKIFRLDPGKFTPHIDSILELSPWPEDHQRDKEIISRAIESHEPGSYEQKFLRPDKSIGHYYSTFQGNYDEQGDLVSIVGTVLDITERKQAEEALATSEYKFRTLFENMQEGVALHQVIYDEQGQAVNYRILDTNPAFEKHTGLKLEIARGRLATEVYGTDNPPFLERWAVVADTGEPSEFETFFEPMQKHFRISAISLARGTFATVFQDITEQRRQEAAIREREEKLRSIFRVAPIGIGLVKDRVITDINDGVCRMTGYSRHELLDQSARILYPSQEDFEYVGREKYRQISEHGTGTTETRWRHKDGSIRHIILGSTPLDTSDLSKGVTFTALDITDRKRAVEALTASEVRYRRLFESAKDGILILDAKTGMIVDVNPFLIRLLGYSYEQFLGKAIWELASLNELVPSIEYFRKLQQERYVRYDNLPLETTDGRRIDVEFVSNVYDVGDTKVIQCNIRDITERKHAEEQIKSLARFPEENPNPVLRVARNGAILYANPASDALRRQTTLFVDEVASPWLQNLLESAFDSGTVIKKEAAFNGSVYQLTIRPVTENEYVNIYARDITERKLAEEAVRESEQKLKAAVYGSPIPQFVIDRNHRVVYWNKALEEISGLRAEEMVNTDNHWLAFYKEKRPCMCDLLVDRHANSIPEWYGAQYRKSRLVADAYEVTDFFPHLGDGGKWLFFTAVSINDSDGNVIGAMETLEDVTGRIKAEMEIHQLNEELEKRVVDRTAQLQAANKELEAFSYSVSHDLRAPLRAIDGFSRILVEDHAAQLPDEAVGYLNRVRNGATHMGRLIDDLLRFSRLSRQSLLKQPVNLYTLVEETWSTLEVEREERRVELVIGELPDCQGDPALLKQVFFNLLGNALKYSRLKSDTRIEIGFLPQVIRTGEPPATNVYFVKDNGVGFDMQYAGKLFGVFQRLHRQEEYEGTGVGLAIVHRIIARHGGSIWAQSEPDKGATFYLTIGDTQTPNPQIVEKAMV